ncbi:MAG: FdhF/YdeP family oxidoreductase [Planctomycetaceae bacterium]
MRVNSGGGFRAIWYTWKKGREAGGVWKLYQAMRSKNACKTCALGMGGQKGGMTNEQGSFPELCKKSLQTMVADMQPGISPNFWAENSVEALARMTPRQLEHCGRLIQPVLYEQGQTHFRPITWAEAFDRIQRKLTSIRPDQSFWYFSGRSSNEAGFLMQLLARVYGTNNVNNCSYYCHQASGVGLQSSVGSGTATMALEDLEHADCVFLIGGNPASNHPRLMTSLMHVRRRGGRVIVINPVQETGLVKFRVPSDPRSLFWPTRIASDYVQPHIGGDLALLWGIAKAVGELGAMDDSFLRDHCRGSEQWKQAVERLPWSEIVAKSGVEQAEIESIARLYANAKRTVFSWTMGITHHTNGVEGVQAIANLAMCRGMVGRPGCGLMPIRGHSNVQGIGSVGATPKLKDAIFRSLQEKFGVMLPTTAGLDTLACMESAASGEVKAAICLGGNLFGSNPDTQFAEHAMSQLDMNVVLSTTLNTGHAHGLAKEFIILPVLARDEEPEATTQESMFNYVRLSDGGPQRVPGPRSEVAVIAEIGSRIAPHGQGIDWDAMRKTATIRDWIAAVVPGFEQIATIDETKKEFFIDGRIIHQPRFPTADGRAVMHIHALPELTGIGEGELRMMTIRSEGQFNTVVYEEEDLYRNQDRRDVILMHPDDLKRLGLQHDQRVTVRSSAGQLPNMLARGYTKVRPGNAMMYYPESNVLVPRSVDPQSRTPAFKNVVVTIDPAVPTRR